MDISLTQQKSIFQIIKEAFHLYISNFSKLTKVMVYPIAAHLIGIPYIILSSYWFMDWLDPNIFIKYFYWIVLATFIVTIPGFALFLNGFWAYLLAMVSLNKYAKVLINKEKEENIRSCTLYVKAKQKIYAYILCLMMLLWIVGLIIPIIPLMIGGLVGVLLCFLIAVFCILLLIIFSVYFSLSFQVLAFEEQDTISVFKRSFSLIKSNFFRTLFLMVVLYIFTGIICPFVIHITLEVSGIVGLIAGYLHGVSERVLNDFLSYFQSIGFTGLATALSFIQDPVSEISKMLVISTIDGIVTAGMLPLGTCCFTLLYFDILTRRASQEISNDV